MIKIFVYIVPVFLSINISASCIKLASNNSEKLSMLSLYSLQGNYKEIDRKLNEIPEKYYIEYYLGYSYLIGKNVLVDYKKAESHLIKAAKYCFSPAHYSLGYLYIKKNNSIEAKKWFFSAKKLGDNLAAYQLGIIYQTEQNIKEALENFEFAANNDFTPAITALGVLYYDGIYVERNFKISFQYFQKAALKNDQLSQNNLAWMYEHGEGINQNKKLAIYWYKVSSNNGFELAKRNLNRILEKEDTTVLF